MVLRWDRFVSQIRAKPDPPHGRVVMAPDFVEMVEALNETIGEIYVRLDNLEARGKK